MREKNVAQLGLIWWPLRFSPDAHILPATLWPKIQYLFSAHSPSSCVHAKWMIVWRAIGMKLLNLYDEFPDRLFVPVKLISVCGETFTVSRKNEEQKLYMYACAHGLLRRCPTCQRQPGGMEANNSCRSWLAEGVFDILTTSSSHATFPLPLAMLQFDSILFRQTQREGARQWQFDDHHVSPCLMAKLCKTRFFTRSFFRSLRPSWIIPNCSFLLHVTWSLVKKVWKIFLKMQRDALKETRRIQRIGSKYPFGSIQMVNEPQLLPHFIFLPSCCT